MINKTCICGNNILVILLQNELVIHSDTWKKKIYIYLKICISHLSLFSFRCDTIKMTDLYLVFKLVLFRK